MVGVKDIANACMCVWNNIANDIPAEMVTTAEMIEISTDADRLAMDGYGEESELLYKLLEKYEWPEVVKMISEHMPYSSWEAGGAMYY